MKSSLQRDNLRKPRYPYSQSPPERKIIKKLQQIHANPIYPKLEFSLQASRLPTERSNGAEDHRVEIEQLFQQSESNREYRFPRRQTSSSSSHSSQEGSLDSLKHVTIYDLASQNKPSKPTSSRQTMDTETRSRCRESEDPAKNDCATELNTVGQDKSPLEVLIGDKDSPPYKSLIKLVESQKLLDEKLTSFKTEKGMQRKLKSGRVQHIHIEDYSEEERTPKTDAGIEQIEEPPLAQNNILVRINEKVEQSSRSPSRNNERRDYRVNRQISFKEFNKQNRLIDNSPNNKSKKLSESPYQEKHVRAKESESYHSKRPSASLKKSESSERLQNPFANRSLGNCSSRGNISSKM